MKARIPHLSLVALALAAALAAGCDRAAHEAAPEHVADDAAADGVAHYTCSMHPSVRNPGPGSCPMCSMALAPVFRRELDSGEIVLDAGRRQQIGVTTARAELRALDAAVRAVGTVTYDQSRLTDVTLKVGGWIDELYADRIGQRVKEGEPLFTLYSPDLFEAQQRYVDALERLRDARKLGSSLSADLLIETRRQRLRLWDLGPDELERLEDRGLPVERVPILAPASGHVIEKNVVAGASVAPGMRLLRIAGLDRVWVEAEVYESELPSLEVGDRATVTLRYLPGREFHGRIAFVYPWLDGATRTGRVRVELPNPGLALKPEMYAEVVFERDLGERLAVPQNAVLYAGDRDFVFLDLGDGRLRPQAVTVGGHAGEWVEILDGVGEGDMVVTSGNFLVAAEARLALALEHWGAGPVGRELPVPALGHGGGHEGHGGGHEGHGNGASPPALAHGGGRDAGDGGGHRGHVHAAASPAPARGPAGHDAHRHDAAPPEPAPAVAGGHDGHDGHGAAGGHDGHGPVAEPPAPDAHNGHAHGTAPPPPVPKAGGDHEGHAHAAEPPAPTPDAGGGHEGHAHAAKPPAPDAHGGHQGHAHPAKPPTPAPDADGGHDGHAHGTKPPPPAPDVGTGHEGHGHGGGHDGHGQGGGDDGHGSGADRSHR